MLRNAFALLSTEAKQDLILTALGNLQAELNAKLEAGQAVALDAGTLAALETITAAVSNFPSDYPDASASAKLDSIYSALVTSAGGIFAEDSTHTSGDMGRLVLGIRWDSDTPTASDGDYTALKLDEAGRLKVATQPASVARVTGSITANGQNVAIECKRFSNLSISMIATTLVGHNASFEASNDSTNGTDGTWYGVQAVRSNANTVETASGVLGGTPAYMWHANVGDYAWFRVRATAHTSGTAAYILRPGAFATEPVPSAQVTGTQPVSFTQAALPAGTARIGFAAAPGIWWDDSSTVLAANATFNGTSRDLTVTATATAMANAATYAKEFRVSAESDQTGTLFLEVSRNGTDWRRIKPTATVAVAGGGFYAEIIHRQSQRYVRVGFTNGATLQTRFTLGSIAMAN
jgi:hypothetical protein